jgi:hypothetical protein
VSGVDGWADQLVKGLLRPHRYLNARPSELTVPFWKATEISLDDGAWDAAERELAFVLAALRSAVTRRDAIPLPRGTVLLALGNGLFAQLAVREHARSAGSVTEASLSQPIAFEKTPHEREKERWSLGDLTGMVAMYSAETDGYGSATTELGARLPHAVHLRGHGLSADIRFHASPLFASPPDRAALASVAAAGSKMLEQSRRDDEQQQQQAYDDDD